MSEYKDKLERLSYLLQLTTYAVTMKNEKLQNRLVNRITKLAEEEVVDIPDLKLL